MATTAKPKVRYVKVKVLPLPGKHKGNIPAKAIREAVRKVVAERRRREAEEAARTELAS